MKIKNILIIGAGWYGCHIGLYLKQQGHDIKIFEKDSDIFLGSSGSNQFRLHTGYHYPRSSETISETKKNFLRFKKIYKNFIYFPKNNIYCIAKDKSLIDSGTYSAVLKAQKLRIINKNFNFLKNVENSFISNEGILLNGKIKKFYKKILNKNIFYNKKIFITEKLKDQYDLIIDCSNTLLKNHLTKNYNYVLTISLVYRKKKNSVINPITIMDGKLPSLYPYADKKDLYTLTHSKFTHIKKFKNFDLLKSYKKNIKKNYILKIKRGMEKDMVNYFPKFKKLLSYKGYFLSYKVLPINNSAKRSIIFSKDKNIISCTSPKITNIFSFQDYISKLIK